ncbi:MAG: ribonuclease P protein component [Acidiferrobacterales bacterium]
MALLGLTSKRRLKSRPQFDRVFNNKCGFRDKYFAVYACPNNEQTPRLGLVVSRRVSTRAVDRNRIKRQIRENFRQSVAELKNLDYVVVARNAVLKETGAALHASLQQHWKRLNKQCGNS